MSRKCLPHSQTHAYIIDRPGWPNPNFGECGHFSISSLCGVRIENMLGVNASGVEQEKSKDEPADQESHCGHLNRSCGGAEVRPSVRSVGESVVRSESAAF